MSTFITIQIPARLNRRPKDARGYPIPAGVMVDELGKPDFRVTNASKWVSLVKMRCCGLCGEPLGRHLAFIGGPGSHQSRAFTDLPMHKECAQYAVQVCPFLAAPNFRYAEKYAEREGYAIQATDAVSTKRPEKFALATTKTFEVMMLEDGTPILVAGPWESTQWWQEGKQIA